MLELREEGVDLEDIAVLYRNHAHSLELQVELTRRNIPYEVRSGLRFFEQRHIKDVLAHLRFVANPRDEVAFARMAQLRPGFGAAPGGPGLAARRRGGAARRSRASSRRVDLPGAARTAFAELQQLLEELQAPAMRRQPGEAVRLVVERSTASGRATSSTTPARASTTSSSSRCSPTATRTSTPSSTRSR